MTLTVARTVADIRQHVSEMKSEGKTVALVPTMGGLHEGHLSLIAKCREVADYVVVSIFVNPKQFNNEDDFTNYPSNEDKDIESIRAHGADIAFIPSATEMYPDEFATNITVNAAIDILCDAHRPGHFGGVATVVSKLFLQVGANFACFGEKDYQQLFIVKRMVADLNIPIEIIPAPTVREDDGLAMSSRNARLTSENREIAPQLHVAMQKARTSMHEGVSIEDACQTAWKTLESQTPFKIEYLEVRCGESMSLVNELGSQCRIFTAAWLGDVRLIDNIQI